MAASRESRIAAVATELGYSFDGEIKIGGNYTSVVLHGDMVYYKGFPLCQANESHEPRSGSIRFQTSLLLQRRRDQAHHIDPSSQVRTGQTTSGH